MKKEKFYQFVPKRNIRKYLQTCKSILDNLCKKLKKEGIKANYYIVGSGKSHLVTRLLIDGVEQPFDLDFNLEVNLDSLPEKFKKDLAKLKEKVRSELNKILKEHKTDFKDGKNTASVIIFRLINNDKTEFSFDLAIISKNKDGNLQRLAHKNNNYNWEMIRNSKDIEVKAEKLRKRASFWSELRDSYLDKKNYHSEYGDEISHPSINIFIEAVNEIYDKNFKNSNKQFSKSTVNNENAPIGSKDIVCLICNKIIGIKTEKRPKREKTLFNFVKSLEKWRKIQSYLIASNINQYKNSVLEQLKVNKKLAFIRNSKRIKWFDS